MRLRGLRLAAFLALPVAMFLAGIAGGASTFVPYPNATRNLVCHPPRDCGCKPDVPLYGESTWVYTGTYRTPWTWSPTTIQLGAWECGNSKAGVDGEIYNVGSCAGFPNPPAGALKQGSGFFVIPGGCP